MKLILIKLIIAYFILLISGCVGPSWHSLHRLGGHPVKSNILRTDYAGSRACFYCHQEIYREYMQSPMHNMTRLPGSAHIHAPFDSVVFHFKNDRVRLESHGGFRWMHLESQEFGNHLYRVTKVIGGHHREDFAGVEVGKSDTLTETILPVSYIIRTSEFRYKGYSVMDPERPGLKPGAVWNQTCIFCHNTVPYLSTILGALSGSRIRNYQGEVVDANLPMDRRWSILITDSTELRNALAAEIRFLRHSSVPELLPLPKLIRTALTSTSALFNETHLIELGIGCESCHGGSQEHVEHPWMFNPSFEPHSGFLRTKPQVLSSQALHAQQITRVCARCHQVLFTGYPWTWEGGHRKDDNPGGAHINSGEARDMLLGNCAVTCTDCHDPHRHDDSQQLARLEGSAGNDVCLRCHSQFQNPQALRTHSHHSLAGQGSLCLNCHMPRKNMSLDTRLSRYHRVGSPNDPVRVERDRPLECALCHGEKSVGEIIDTMEHWWPHKYDRKKITELYGSFSANPIEATLRLGKPHEKAVALYLSGKRHEMKSIALVTHELKGPYPLVRYYAENALVDLLGVPSPLDMHQDTTAIAQAAEAWIRKAAGLH